jgi:hypothetical protein
MIRPDDFQIRIGQSCSATYVQVTHKPTGNKRAADQAHGEPVAQARERLIRELTAEVFREEDFQVDHLRVTGGGRTRVTHLPSGRSIKAAASESTSRDLINSLLDQLHKNRLI